MKRKCDDMRLFEKFKKNIKKKQIMKKKFKCQKCNKVLEKKYLHKNNICVDCHNVSETNKKNTQEIIKLMSTFLEEYNHDRILISEEEIECKYGKPIATLKEPWKHSNIYYDKENDRFIEERYHEEYLDTGTVRDGCFLISETILWGKLVEICDEEGMRAYLKIRKKDPKV